MRCHKDDSSSMERNRDISRDCEAMSQKMYHVSGHAWHHRFLQYIHYDHMGSNLKPHARSVCQVSEETFNTPRSYAQHAEILWAPA